MRLSALLALALALVPASASAEDAAKVVINEKQEDEKPKPPIKDRNNFLALKNAFYVQMDHGGNPYVDENAMIVESLVVLRKEVVKSHVVSARFKGAIISSASYDLAKNRGVLVSGATTRIHNPGSGEIGLGYAFRPGDWSVGIAGVLGFEHAYRARGLAVDATKSFFDENTTLSLFGKGYYDTVRMIRFDGTHDDDQLRRTIWLEAGWTQILTPISLFNLTLTQVQQWGFLATSFNWVYAGGNNQTAEVAPRTRSRTAATLRYKQALDDDNAIELGYRYYRDDWGIRGHTLQTQAFLYFRDHTLLIEPLYRYHFQTEADFFARRFDFPRQYMTSDSDLGTFSGHMFALNIIFIDVYFLWLFADYDIALNYYHRTDGIDMLWMTMGFDLPI